MPEGPEIRRAADQLVAAIRNEPLRHVELNLPGIERYAAALVGQRVLAITPRGKALLTRFDGGKVLYSHNQLYGVWRVARAGERPATTRQLRVVLETERKALLLYSASDISMLDESALSAHPFLSKLGPDALDEATTVAEIEARLGDPRFRRRQLAALLLDQAFVAGLGNYLRSEILFAAGLAAARRPMDLDDDELKALAEACLALPRASYRTRGRRAGPHGAKFRFRVFDRAGEPCEACGTPIERSEANSRRLYACPSCQA